MSLYPASTAEQMQMAAQALQNRAPDTAIQILLPMIQRKPSAGGLFLLAAARRMRGEFVEAEALLRQTLALDPKHVQAHVALGHLLHLQKRYKDAAQSFQQALRLSPGMFEAHLGLAEALRDGGETQRATQAYRDALHLKPDHLTARYDLGMLLNSADRPEEAEAILRPALELTSAPNQTAVVEHALGISALRQNHLEEALDRFNNARELNPALPKIDLDRAAVLEQLYREGEAITILERLVEREPLNHTAHHLLNKLLYSSRRDEEFLASYDRAAALQPGAHELRLAKARFLVAAGRFDEAHDNFAAVRRADPGNKNAIHGQLLALSQLQNFEAALAEGAAAMRLFPDDINIRATTAMALLRAGDPKAAESMLAGALAMAPNDQMCLALRGLAWRMQRDPREEILMAYESAVRIYDLEVPKGYRDMQSFNADLDASLNRVHSGRREYIDQSLRNGSQTNGNIFDAGQELVDRLKASIAKAVQSYIADMPHDASHPLFGRRQRDFNFLGSWSSRLRDQGFHTSHIHAQGWISSCYYVSLPDAVTQHDGHEGWIEFGRPSFDLALDKQVQRVVQPRSGQLILFPSYMLHGTVPFHSAQNRTTIAFDVAPG